MLTLRRTTRCTLVALVVLATLLVAGPADGRLGTWTRSAVIRFQSANGLARTGSLSAATRTRMYAGKQVRCDRRPVPGGTSGRRIVISQGQNYVWLVRADGGVEAQGGVVDNPSYLRPGTYTAGAKCGRAGRIANNFDASGRLRLANFTRFAPCGIGFHRIPQYRSTGAQIHPDFLLGTNFKESHGCIRVSRALSGRIWAFASPGTRVLVLAR
ncbi:MAG: L,D-transpeptidase family protein [Nocardioidaceae bacterium]